MIQIMAMTALRSVELAKQLSRLSLEKRRSAAITDMSVKICTAPRPTLVYGMSQSGKTQNKSQVFY